MSEQTFFQHEDVQVTNARFVNGAQTYAMSNVTSVKSFEETPKRFWPILAIVVALTMLVPLPQLGVPVLLIAAAVLYKQKTMYHVMLATSGGEVSALKTHQREYLDRVVAALNQAIIVRG